MGASLEFESDIYVLYHDTRICAGFQTTVHIGNVCQTVQVLKIKDKVDVILIPDILTNILIHYILSKKISFVNTKTFCRCI